MILNIRGALGTQILELLVGLAKHGSKITEIHVNTGGRVVETVKKEYISELFDINIPISIVQGTSKQNAWRVDNFILLTKINAQEILPLKKKPSETNETLIHVRGLDRQTASVDDYRKICQLESNNIAFIGDDKTLIEQISNQPYVMGDVYNDWLRCISCSQLYGSFSSFTVSAMLYDVNKQYSILSKENSNGPHALGKAEYNCINTLIKNKFTKAKWI